MAGIFSQQKSTPDPSTCFVMMPFADDFSAIYRLIQRCCNEQGLKCIRADEDVSPGKITGKIYDLVSKAGVIIADMTGRNPNVFYELGLAHAISDNVVLLTQSTEDVPFDLRDFMHIRYTNTFEGAERLATDLSKVLSTIMSSAIRQISPDDQRRIVQVSDPNKLAIEEIDVGLAHLQAQIARDSNDMKHAKEWLQKALDTAKDGGGSAPEIGNCAIEAEICKFYALAESLYEVAVARDPAHVNNRQCYVSFLLDHRANDPIRMELAGNILLDLESTTERQERTRSLKAQYLTQLQKGSGKSVDMDAMIAGVIGDGKFSTIEEAAPALMLLQKAGKYEQMKEIIDCLRQKLDRNAVRSLDRILADAYAGSDSENHHKEAIAAYEKLLELPDDDSSDVKHNLATLLYAQNRHDSTQRVNQLWTEAYAEKPNNTAIRKAFAQYLVHKNRKQDAAKVLTGEPIG